MLGFENGDDSPFLKILRKVSNKYGTVNFATLNLHHGPGGECDASLTRCDYHIGDSVHANKERVRRLVACSSDGRYISLRDLVRFQLVLFHESLAHESFQMSLGHFIGVRMFNIAGLFALLSDGDKGIPVKRIWPFFIHGRLPSDWTKPKITAQHLTHTLLLALIILISELAMSTHTPKIAAWYFERKLIPPILGETVDFAKFLM